MPDNSNPIGVADVIEKSPVGRLQKVTLMLCTLIIIFDGFDILAISFTAPAITTAWAMPKSELGLVFSSVLVGMTLGAMILGPLGDRIGRRPLVLVSVLIFALFSGLTALASSFEELLVLRFLTGLGLGGAMPNTTALMTELVPERLRNLTVGIIFIGVPVGGILGGLFSAWLIPTFGWQAVFFAGGILPLLLWPILYLQLPESPRFLMTNAHRKEELVALLGRISPNFDGVFVLTEPTTSSQDQTRFQEMFAEHYRFTTPLLWLAFFTNLMAIYFLFTWIPTLLVDLGHSLTNATLATVTLNVGGALSPLLLAWLVVKFGSRLTLTGWFILGAASLFFLSQTSDVLSLLFLGTFLCGVFVIGGQVGLNALASFLYATHIRSTGLGWALGIGRIGSIAGPIFTGVLIETELELTEYFAIFGIVVIVTTISIALIRHHQKPIYP